MNPLLAEGLTDAIGFLGGVLLAFGMSLMLGVSPLGEGYGNRTIAGILLTGAGGALGVQLARRWRKSRTDKKD